ncbi:MAG: SDR family NAD(P)-dependent oxidoreductase [Moorea sp. SIO4A3]|nr:SDR family NAD(P)-dependent oxidoreductase [Moorena sp. SIO4A3]
MAQSKFNPSYLQNEELVEILSEYFNQRGNFLAKVIQADFQNLPQFNHKKNLKNGDSKGKKSVQLLTTHQRETNGKNSTTPQPSPVVNQPIQPTVSTPTTQNVEEILLNLVVKQTGFPADSITLQSRLLDDINLDSIKGGELIAAVATECNVAGKVDPGTLANASLQEIVDAVRAEMASSNSVYPEPVVANTQPKLKTEIPQVILEIVTERTGFPAESLSLDLRLLDDLNLDSIKTAEFVAEAAKIVGVSDQIDPSNFANASLGEIAQTLEKLAEQQQSPQPNSAPIPMANESTPWVRNFVVEYLAEEAPPLVSEEENWETANLFAVDNWTTAKILIVCEPTEVNWVEPICRQLDENGAQVEIVTFAELIEQRLVEQPELTHFIAVLPRNPVGEMSAVARLERAMQRVRSVATLPAASAGNREYSTVAYLQFGGGYFGRLPQMSDMEQSCTIGFASSLHLERADLKVRVIDLPVAVESTKLSETIVTELSRPEAFIAVGYDANLTRRIPRPRVQDRTLYQPRELNWSYEDVLLISGGAKGITAECAIAFARITGIKTALVGTSPHPQDAPSGNSSAEIASTLRRFSQEGLTCRYYQCDITNDKAVVRLVQQVEKELGQITGVIHGAALNKPRRVENSTLAEARKEVAPKILGVLNLCQALATKPPKLFVGFSSISAVLGLPGNTWYGFSNEALDLILRQFGEEHPETSVLAIAFSVWSEVGMGARMGTVRNLARMGIEAMPTEDGVRHFLQLMLKDPGDSQVVVTSKLGGVETMRRGFDTWRTKRFAPPATSKFIENINIIELGVEVVSRTHLSLERDSYVKDHIYKGSYLFPTVFGLEAMTQIAAYATQREELGALRIEDIRLERPIVVDPEKGVEIELRALVAESQFEHDPWTVQVEIRTERTGFTVAHFAATFVLDAVTDEPVKQPIQLPEAPLDIEPKQDLYSWLLFQGPRFQRLQTAYTLNSKQFVFRTQIEEQVPEPTSDRAFGPFLLGDPYYRDSLLQAVQPIIPQDICLPIRIDCLEVYQTTQNCASCLGLAINEGREGQQYNTSVVSTCEDGGVIEKLEGYQLRILEHRPENPTAEELAHPTPRDEQQLSAELNRRSHELDVAIPETSLEYLQGLHSLSAEERHQQELPVLSRTVAKVLKTE